MTAEFARLQSFISAFGELEDFHDTGSLEFQQHYKTNFANFQREIETCIAEQDSMKKLTVHIRYAQVTLTRIANKMQGYCSDALAGNGFANLLELYRDIYREMIEILEYLHSYYSAHFDNDGLLPEGFRELKGLAIKIQATATVGMLQKRAVDTRLLKILENYLNCMHCPCDFHIETWRQYDYLLDMHKALEHFSETPVAEDQTYQLIALLIGYNFNPGLFYEYMRQYATELANPDSPFEEQELALIDLQAEIRDIRREHKAGYDTELDFIGDSIAQSIERAIGKVARLKEIYREENNLAEKRSNFYFDLHCTLEELFLLFRILMNLKFLSTRYKARLYAFVKRHIHTERTGIPSEKYMRNIFGPERKVPTVTIKRLRAGLVLVLDYIDFYYQDQLKF
jgi:hypothetical protein